MAITKQEIRDDIILRLTQGKPSSDFEVSDSQIDRWIDIARDRIVSDYLLRTTLKNLHSIDPAYIYTATVVVVVSSTTNYDLSVAPHPSVLSVPLRDDKGVIRVRMKLTSDSSYRKAEKVDLFQLDGLETMEFTKPTYERPVVNRIGEVFTVTGPSIAEAALNTLEVDYVPAMTGATLDYSVSGAHVEEITTLAEEIGRRELGLIVVDDVNDGNQNKLA